MGLVRGFVGGVGQAMSDLGKMAFADKLQSERDEANHLRDRALMQDKQTYMTSEREAGQQFTSSEREQSELHKSMENELNRSSNKEIASAKSSKSNATTNMKDVEFLMREGKKTLTEAVSIVYPGAKIKHTNAEGEQIIVIQDENNKWKEIGRVTTNKQGKQEWVDPGEPVTTEPTTDDIAQANREYDKKASMWKSDKSQFGMSGAKWKRMRAQEIANSRAGSKATPGIINSATGNAQTGQVSNPAPATAAEKPAAKAGKSKPTQAALAYYENNKDDPKIRDAFKAKYGYLPD